MVKRIRMSTPSRTYNRENKRRSRVFVDLGGKRHVASVGESKYSRILGDDFSRHAWVYFTSYTSDATDDFE